VSRATRQGAILRIIRERPVSTQADLADALREAGYDVVQTTVSRDITDLGLVKVRASDGRLVYAPPTVQHANGNRLDDMRAALRRWALTIESSGQLIVITTPAGYTGALAQAMDVAEHPAILGTIAGENTILVVAREPTPGAELRDELRTMALDGAA
jgi:transcriptional regulator of arginine metabolism